MEGFVANPHGAEEVLSSTRSCRLTAVRASLSQANGKKETRWAVEALLEERRQASSPPSVPCRALRAAAPPVLVRRRGGRG